MTGGTQYVLDNIYRTSPKFLNNVDLELAMKHIRDRYQECVDDLKDCALFEPMQSSKRMGVQQAELMNVKKSLMDRLESLLKEFVDRKRII